jgi:hypothetical protein
MAGRTRSIWTKEERRCGEGGWVWWYIEEWHWTCSTRSKVWRKDNAMEILAWRMVLRDTVTQTLRLLLQPLPPLPSLSYGYSSSSFRRARFSFRIFAFLFRRVDMFTLLFPPRLFFFFLTKTFVVWGTGQAFVLLFLCFQLFLWLMGAMYFRLRRLWEVSLGLEFLCGVWGGAFALIYLIDCISVSFFLNTFSRSAFTCVIRPCFF